MFSLFSNASFFNFPKFRSGFYDGLGSWKEMQIHWAKKGQEIFNYWKMQKLLQILLQNLYKLIW